MSSTNPGFRATDNEVFYVAPSGRSWIVSSPDFDGIREIAAADIPDAAIDAGGLVTPDEALEYCAQVQEESGEFLIEEA